MPDNDEQQPQGQPDGPPEYKVFRARRGLFRGLRKPDLSGLGKGGPKLPKLPKRSERPGRERRRGERSLGKQILKWVGIAALGWIFLSFLAFAVSAQLQAFKLSGDAKSALHGNPVLLPSAQTILVLGTDARPPDTQEAGALTSEECFDQQAQGEAPHDKCEVGQFRADSLMLIRAGGGAFRKLSIPRDAYAEIPGQSPGKINGAFAFGGAAAQIEATEDFLDIEVDHVAIVNFTGFEDLIDSVGGVKVDVPVKLCADISGGAGNGQGGVTLRLRKGENTLSGEKALAYSRARIDSETPGSGIVPCPGPGTSAYALGYDDFDRARAQQAVIGGIKDRLTDPLRIPYNFIKGPIIGWNAPKAFVSDMGLLTMPQLILAAAIGGDSEADVLCKGANAGCGPGPRGSIEVPESERRRAVKELLNG